MRALFEFTKLVVEPSGAVGVAALLAGRVANGGATGVILSGGNVALEALAQLLAPPSNG
jgi:threonine dehydratase